jgi:histidinol-phosphate aminotransferase
MTAITRYVAPGFDDQIDLDLSRNEGVPGEIDLASLLTEPHPLVSRYPDETSVRDLLAGSLGLESDQVLVTAGGDEGLARCFRSFAGTRVATTTPTFEMIGIYAEQNRSELIEVPWFGGEFPLEAFVATGADVAVVVSPNNPTGTTITTETLRAISSAFGLVVLDGAYVEFADNDPTGLALELGNVLVIRTLSKAYGLAGLRVGYVVGPPELVGRIARFGNPYAVSTVSLRVAGAALAGPPPDLDGHVCRRTRLTSLLEQLGLAPLPSEGNFVLATDTNPEWLVKACSSLGIGVRSFPNRPGLERSVRITVPRDDQERTRLEKALCAAVRPEALLFDLDGVIADVSSSYRQAIVATAASFGVTVDNAEVDRLKSAGDANDDWDLTRRLCEEKGVIVPYETVVERFEDIYHGTDSRPGLKRQERPLTDRSELTALADLLPLAIVTGRPRKDAAEFLERFDLASAFRTVVAREDAPMKPDPTPVRLALERLGVSHAWLLGDTRDDLVAARAAGVIPIGIGNKSLTPTAAVLETASSTRELLDETLS